MLDGDAELLYDPDTQREAQEGLWASDDFFLFFAYPPPVAAVYSLFARLPYAVAQLLHSAIMGVAVVGAFWACRPRLPAGRPHGVIVAAVAFAYLPLTASVVLGQNAALALLALALVWRLSDTNPTGSGLALGILFFKPQYVLPLLGLFVLRRAWRTTGAALAAGAGWWLAGAAMMGPGWLGHWVSVVLDFRAEDIDRFGGASISWLGVARAHLTQPLDLWVGAVLVALTASVLVAMWRERTDLALPLAAAAPGVALMAPHSMHMDSALVALTVAGLVAAGYRHTRILVVVLLGLGLGVAFHRPLPHTPALVATILAFTLAAAHWAKTRARSRDAIES